MNWQVFGLLGYLSIILSVAALASWLLYWIKPRRLLVNIAFVLILAAFFGARIHSGSYINRIEIDPSAKLAELEARQKAKEQALMNSRSDEVAQIRFAEDEQGEFYDTAGMDETDLKYMKAIADSETPDWKKNKQGRGTTDGQDDSLESLIGGEATTEGADVAELEKEQKAEPILLDEAAVVLANKLDLWNLRLSNWLFWLAIILLLVDYLRRANLYAEASRPLPMPSAVLNALTPLPVVRTRPQPPRRSIPEELKWLIQRGDSFIYFSDQPDQSEPILRSLAKLRRRPFNLDLIQVNEHSNLSDEFIFESLWYGRASFIVDSPAKAQELLKHFIERLEKRRETKARTARTVHLVWDLDTPIPQDALEDFSKWAAPAGYSLFINPTRSS